MFNYTKIIEATLAQKPLAVKEAIDEIMAEKCRAIVDNIQPEFGNAVMEEQEEAAELQNFFEVFHADHGDKSIEEQLEIMEAFDLQIFFEAFYADHGDKSIEEQLEIMEAFEAELAEKKIDHDKDGDNDFDDVKIARMIASGMSKEEALKKVKEEVELDEGIRNLSPAEAHGILTNADAHGDFFSLRDHSVAALANAAKEHNYRGPRNSGASIPRSFHDALRKKAEKAKTSEDKE